MAKAVKPKKVTTTHPRTGSQFAVESGIYEPFKAAILQSLKGSKGKTFTALTDDVVKIIKKKMPVYCKKSDQYLPGQTSPPKTFRTD